MPPTKLIFYKDDDGSVPVYAWLKRLASKDRRAAAKCIARIRRLGALGHELRRPEADLLRGGVYELRARAGRVHYRILYGFDGRDIALLVHALTKEGRVPPADIERAIDRLKRYKADRAGHRFDQELSPETEIEEP